MDDKKLYVTNAGYFTFVCPTCGASKEFDSKVLNNNSKSVKITCKCGSKHRRYVEFRQYIRKETHLVGECTFRRINKKIKILIEDLSVPGVGFKLLYKRDSPVINMLKVGDLIELNFILDNTRRTKVLRRCEIKVIRGVFIGATFEDESYAKDIGFYLMN